MTPKDVDIVITTYNRAPTLLELLKGLGQQKNVSFNLIISDDGSKSIFNPADVPIVTRYLWHRDDGYHKVARLNEAMQFCVSPFMILLDDDCLPVNTGFVSAHLGVLRKHPVSRGYLRFGKGADDGEWLVGTWFSAANLGIRTDVMREVGYFDPAYDGAYGYEDLDLGKTLEKAGHRAGPSHLETAAWHVGKPHADGDRSDAAVGHNRAYFKSKWGIEPRELLRQ